MTNEEIVEMIQEGINVKENLSILWEQVERFTYKMMKPYLKYTPPSNQTTCDDNINMNDVTGNSDLMQEAFLSMVDAVKGFECDAGYRFITYYGWKLKSKCFNHIKNNNVMTVSDYMQNRIRQYKNLISELGYKPSQEETMKELELTTEQYNQMIQTINRTSSVSLDKSVKESEDESITIGDTIPNNIDYEGNIVDSISLSEVWECVQELENESERIVIDERFKQEKTLKDVGSLMNLSGERIRKIEKSALHNLRDMKKIQHLAHDFDIDCSLAYSSGVGRMKAGKGSNVEFLALKKIEYEEEFNELKKRFLI